MQALSLLASTLRRGGARTLAVESHGLSLHRELVRAAGLTTRPVTVDGAGARVDEFGDCDAALLTPSHQFPLGVPLAARRRAAVLEWARARGGLIIEDDYDGEFRYDRKPIGALQGLAPDLVVYAGTASKSLVPALGLAWLVVPLRLLDPVVEAKRLSDGYTGLLEQLTLDEFISSGGYDRHVRRSRLRYRRRRDQLLAALAERTSGITVTGIAAGLHAVAELRGLRAEDEPGHQDPGRPSRAGHPDAGLLPSRSAAGRARGPGHRLRDPARARVPGCPGRALRHARADHQVRGLRGLRLS